MPKAKAKKSKRREQEILMRDINLFNLELKTKLSRPYSHLTADQKFNEADIIVQRMIALNEKIDELFNHPSDIHRKKTAKNILLNSPLIKKNDEKIMAIQVLDKISSPVKTAQIEALNVYIKAQFVQLAEQEKRKKTMSDYAKKGLKIASYLTVPTLAGHGLYHAGKKIKETIAKKPEGPKLKK